MHNHKKKHPNCKNPQCTRCHANALYHKTVTGAPMQVDVHENQSLAVQIKALRGVMWDLQRRSS